MAIGYYPKAPKEEHLETAKTLFQDTELIITSEGKRHLGSVVGTADFRDSFTDAKVTSWVKVVEELGELAKIAEE